MKAIVPVTSSSSSSYTSVPLKIPATVRPRKDLPIVHNYTRGDKREAMAAAADDGLMAHAVSNYIQDWRSAGDASQDYWSTCLATRWVSVSFKFRHAHTKHIELGYPWGLDLVLARRRSRTLYYHIAPRTVTIGERCSIESARHWICSCLEDLRSIGHTAASKCRFEGLGDMGTAAASST